MPDKPTPLYYIISYAFPTADRCMYYRRKGKQCKVNNCSIELTNADPYRSQKLRLY